LKTREIHLSGKLNCLASQASKGKYRIFPQKRIKFRDNCGHCNCQADGIKQIEQAYLVVIQAKKSFRRQQSAEQITARS
jgi:hypothetical protein